MTDPLSILLIVLVLYVIVRNATRLRKQDEELARLNKVAMENRAKIEKLIHEQHPHEHYPHR